MKTVWKFELEITFSQKIAVPRGGNILWLATQGRTPCLWIEVDPESPTIERSFATYGTGDPMLAINRTYVGSYMLANGALAFHVYELR